MCLTDMARPVRIFAPAGPVPPPPAGQSWEGLMDMALAEACKAGAEGEVPVGAIVAAPDGEVLAACHNRSVGLHDPTAHAEILALRAAGAALSNYRLNGCVLVVTLEPCPMCAAALLHARLAGVVYGAADPLAGAVASCAEYLDWPGNGPWHMGGIRAEACAGLLQDFFRVRRGE